MLEKLLFYFKHSINDLSVNKQRTFFALLSIAAGVAAVVSLQTVGVMIQDSLTGNLRETNRGDLRISMQDFNTDASETLMERDGIIEPLDNDEGFRISENGLQVLEEWVAENYEGDYRFTYRQSSQDSIAAFSIGIPAKDRSKTFMLPYIVETDEYPLYGDITTEADELLADVLNEPTDIVLSRNLADELDGEIGDLVRVSGASEDFTLTGIVPTDSESGFQNVFGSIIGYYYLDVRSVELFDDMAANTAEEVYIGIDDPDAVEDLGRALNGRYFYLNPNTTVELKEDNEALASAVNDMVTVMGLVSILIGGIGIVNTMLVVVNRRTVEVAVLKTLGLEPEEVTILFLVEAALMGVVGSLLGILLGWVLAYALQDIGGRFVAQSLGFRIALTPALNGLIIGVLVTTIFGFLPTLAAGQVRPASVLRPSEAVVPKSGRLQSFAALVVVLMALSLVAQGFIGDLLSFGGVITGLNGAILGLLLAIPIVLGGFLSMRAGRRGRSWALRVLLWMFLLVALPAGGFAFGYFVPAIIVLTGTFILTGSLYLLLLLLIWALGGGRIQEFPVIGALPALIRIPLFLFCPLWTAFVIAVVVLIQPGETALAIFLGVLFFIHIPAIIVTLTLPAWVVGQIVQRFTFLDLKVALRAMVANKARGASTLLALVIGIFTLSLLTMLVGMVTAFIGDLLADQEGGNVLIFPAGGDETVQLVENTLEEHEGVRSYVLINTFDAEFVSLFDVSEDQRQTLSGLNRRIREARGGEQLNEFETLEFGNIDGRQLSGNLPDVEFLNGRQLDSALDGEPDTEGAWPIVLNATQEVVDAGIEVGDLITLEVGSDEPREMTFRIVGLVDRTDGNNLSLFTSSVYAPLAAFEGQEPDDMFVLADIIESEIPAVRREMSEIPAVFFFEISLINDLITGVINQFASFPILVAALALFTGGVVIANSVALSTMERRREIAIMKAVGVQRERVLGMLLLENGVMGFIGGLIGVGIGVLILVAALELLFEGELGTSPPYDIAFGLMALCVGISLVAAVISVWGASGEKPLNVLRYD